MATTTLTSWALLIWKAIREKGLDPSLPFKRAGLDPSKLGDGQARYDANLMTKLWEEAILYSKDDDLGIAVGKLWSPTTFHALGFAWLASGSLLEAFIRLERYSKLVNNSLVTKLEKIGTQYQFSFSNSENMMQVHSAANDAGLSAIVTMCRLLAGSDFAPLSVTLTRPYRAPSKLESYLGVTADYKNKENTLLLDAVNLEKELDTANALLVQNNEQLAREYLLQIEKSDIVSCVKSNIIELLPSGNASEKRVAIQMNTTQKTMQRQLKNEGANFKNLLNSTRQEMAQSYIRNSQMSLTEISYLLGFSEQANFTRAFKRWTGLSPSKYRSNITSNRLSVNA